MSGIYDGALTREQFMFLEMRKVAQMTIQGMTCLLYTSKRRKKKRNKE